MNSNSYLQVRFKIETIAGQQHPACHNMWGSWSPSMGPWVLIYWKLTCLCQIISHLFTCRTLFFTRFWRPVSPSLFNGRYSTVVIQYVVSITSITIFYFQQWNLFANPVRLARNQILWLFCDFASGFRSFLTWYKIPWLFPDLEKKYVFPWPTQQPYKFWSPFKSPGSVYLP